MRKDTFSSLFWLLLAIYVSIESYRYDLGKWGMPGPGYFPFGAAIFLGVISLSVLVKTMRKVPSEEKSIVYSERVRWQNIMLILFLMIAYIFLLNLIGFVLCTFLFFVFFLRLVAAECWSKTLIISFSVATGSYLLFYLLLDAQLPEPFLKFLGRLAWRT
jgi:putative tricarboxylic transport membrane protein